MVIQKKVKRRLQAQIFQMVQAKKVLFDNTHGQTAGAADWVIDGGFSDFADALRADHFTVDQLERTIPFTYGEQAVTFDKLKDYDVFIIGEANIPYKKIRTRSNASICTKWWKYFSLLQITIMRTVTKKPLGCVRGYEWLPTWCLGQPCKRNDS
ncbi:hypothetical protein GCM10020331_056280 [Ectobacillus funiculus]